jgi:hypothetical protein
MVALSAISASASAIIDPSLRIVLALSLLGVGICLIGVTVVMIERLAAGQLLRYSQLTADSLGTIRTHSLSWVALAAVGAVSVGVAASITVGYAYGFENSSLANLAIPLADASPGACFEGKATDEVIIVSCDEFHDGQLVAHFELSATSYPGIEALTQFSQTQCHEQYELFSGIGSGLSDVSLLLVAPDADAWGAGKRTAQCALAGDAEQRLRLSAENRTARVRLAILQAGACYARDLGFLTFRTVDCSNASFEVASVLQLSLLIDAPYPENLDEVANSACPEPQVAFPPNKDQWLIGQRHMLCTQ